MFTIKNNKGYVLLNSIIVLSLIMIIATLLVKLASIKLQDSYCYSKSNNVVEFTNEEEMNVREIENLINNDITKRSKFVENYNNKVREIYKHSSTISIVTLKNKTYLKERRMSDRRLKEIHIIIEEKIIITPGLYKTNYEVDND